MTDKSFEETKQADVTESWEIGCFGQSNHNRMAQYKLREVKHFCLKSHSNYLKKDLRKGCFWGLPWQSRG